MSTLVNERVVIVGGGAAGAECAARLRMANYPGQVTILSADSHPPYELPALSKAYLAGDATYQDVLTRPYEAYADHGIDLRLNTQVDRIDTDEHSVRLSDGGSVPYSYLVLATGGEARRLPVPGAAESAHVFYLRTMADADALRGGITPESRVAIVGGGYLGLEVASVARRIGATVTVLEGLPRLLSRVTSPPVSEFFARLHRSKGVDMRLDAKIERIEDRGDHSEIILADGAPVAADLIFVSIGLLPSVHLAADAGLDVDNGIRVDEHGRTSARDVFAAGDCTSHPDVHDGGFRRLESMPNALEMAATVAASISGSPAPYEGIPWFWSEQYDVKLQTIGLFRPGDEFVVRGEAAPGESFAVFYLRDGVVRAADVISDARVFAAAKSLVNRRIHASPSDLANCDLPLKSLITPATIPSA